MQTKGLTAFDLYTFMLEFQKAVKEGYEVSDLNEYYPVSHIGHFNATLVKKTSATKASKA